MAKETLTTRVTHLEGCYGEIEKSLVKLDYDINNGMSDRLATAISSALREEQERERKLDRDERTLQLEEQKVANETMGRKKDRANRILIAAVAPATVGALKLAEFIFGG